MLRLEQCQNHSAGKHSTPKYTISCIGFSVPYKTYCTQHCEQVQNLARRTVSQLNRVSETAAVRPDDQRRRCCFSFIFRRNGLPLSSRRVWEGPGWRERGSIPLVGFLLRCCPNCRRGITSVAHLVTTSDVLFLLQSASQRDVACGVGSLNVACF